MFRRKFKKVRFAKRRATFDKKISRYFPLALETRPAQTYGGNQVNASRSNFTWGGVTGLDLADDDALYGFTTTLRNNTYTALQAGTAVNWTEHIDLPGVVNFYNTELKYMKWNLCINQPVTMDKIKYEFMGVICPLLPVQSSSLPGQADMALLQAECIKQFGGSFHDKQAPKRIKPMHREMAVIWKKTVIVSNRHGPGGTGLISGTRGTAAPTVGEQEDFLQTSKASITRNVICKKNFGGKMRFTVFSNAGNWIPGCTTGFFYFFWGGDRTTPLMYFLLTRISHMGVSFVPQVTPVLTTPAGPLIAQPWLGTTNNYIQQTNDNILITSTYYSWYRNENPGSLTNPGSGPTSDSSFGPIIPEVP